MNITAIIYDADARRTAYILGTVIGNCKLFPAERAPRDWSGYANVITVTAGEDGPVVTAGLQKRVTFRPKGEDETVAAAELIAKAFCPPEAPMPTDALKARIDAFLEAHNTLALATGCGKWDKVHAAGIPARGRQALHPHRGRAEVQGHLVERSDLRRRV